jgi:hypothetical protein
MNRGDLSHGINFFSFSSGLEPRNSDAVNLPNKEAEAFWIESAKGITLAPRNPEALSRTTCVEMAIEAAGKMQ